MRFFLFAAAALSGLAQPIAQHPGNPHYFLFRGKAVALVTSGEHYGAVLNGDVDYKRYLAALAADALNYTRIFTGSYVEVPGSFGIERNTLAPRPESFIAPWARVGGKFDLKTWNPAYFDRLKDFVREAGARGIVVEVTLFCATYGEPQWKVHPFNPANNSNGDASGDWKKLNTLDNGGALEFQERLTRKVVAELSGFDNVVFEIQNEPWADQPVMAGRINPYLRLPARDVWPNTVDLASEASIAWQTRVAEWIAAEEAKQGKRHLVAQNICNYRYPVRDVIPGVSILNFHYAFPEAAAWNLWLNKVIGYDETGFIGSGDSVYRKQAWNFLLSGGGLFNHLDYSFSVGHEDGSDNQPASPGGGSAALRRQVAVLSRALHALPFLEMKPDAASVACEGCVSRCFSRSGQAYLVFVEGPSPATVRLALPPGRYRAEWTDTQSGTKSPAGELTAGENALRLTSPAFREDIALTVVRR